MPGELTITEYTVLGIIWRHGPCTPYAVTGHMATSPSSFYRKRASTTYKVVDKLIKTAFIREVGAERGPRRDRLVEVTPSGRSALHQWALHVPPEEATHSNDLIRLRLNFFELLSYEETIDFLDEAAQFLKESLAQSEAELETRTHTMGYLTLLGFIYETRARLDWLEVVRVRLLSEHRPKQA